MFLLDGSRARKRVLLWGGLPGFIGPQPSVERGGRANDSFEYMSQANESRRRFIWAESIFVFEGRVCRQWQDEDL